MKLEVFSGLVRLRVSKDEKNGLAAVEYRRGSPSYLSHGFIGRAMTPFGLFYTRVFPDTAEGGDGFFHSFFHIDAEGAPGPFACPFRPRDIYVYIYVYIFLLYIHGPASVPPRLRWWRVCGSNAKFFSQPVTHLAHIEAVSPTVKTFSSRNLLRNIDLSTRQIS